MALNALTVRNAKGRERPYKLSDSGGLYLFIQPKGQRYWRLAYRIAGKQRTMALGVFPDVELAEAREKRDAVRKILAAGLDPVEVDREMERKAKLAAKATFKVVAQEWLAKCEKEGRAPITLHKQRWLLDFAYPRLANRPVNEISGHEVYEVLEAIQAKGHFETARRLRSTCSLVIRYAVATGRAERDVCVDLRGALIAPKVKHLAAITKPKEAGDLLYAIEGFDGYRVTHTALRLAAHLFVRPGELRQAEWSEFDFNEKIWTIPAEKMKMRRVHAVPLSKQVMTLIEDIRPLSGTHRYLFPAQGKRDRPMCENTINLALQRIGFGGGRMTAHGFRSMASTLLNQMKRFHPDVIERQLAHLDTNSIRRIYDRGEHWDERVLMMQIWSDYLDALRAEASERAVSENRRARNPAET